MRFPCLVGYSDHTQTHEASLAATALGAAVLERHVTIDRSLPGPDHACSLDPVEFTNWVKQVRGVEECLQAPKAQGQVEAEAKVKARKAIYLSRDLQAGEELSEANLCTMRPVAGIEAKDWDRVLGRRLKRSIAAGQALQEEDLA